MNGDPKKTAVLQMGLKHCLSCLGCYWAQMLIMFAAGAMNQTGMLVITGQVHLEKNLSDRCQKTQL
jgi:predicted metal-binding membrane protein